MNKLKSLKYFKDQCKKAEPGKKYKIKFAHHWEIYKGWGGHYWGELEYIGYQGHSAIFQDNMTGRNHYVSYGDIKTGKVLIMWEPECAFSVVDPSIKEEVKKLHEPGMLFPYK